MILRFDLYRTLINPIFYRSIGQPRQDLPDGTGKVLHYGWYNPQGAPSKGFLRES